MRQGLGGMPHATVFRGPQVQESQESVSEVGKKTGLWVHTALIPQTVRVKSSFSPSSVSKGKMSCLLLTFTVS